MNQEKTFHSLRDFYPFYLSEHQNPISRKLHFLGTGLVILAFAAFLVCLHGAFLVAIPIIGYGFAWVGHYFFEHNRPATFEYPLYSLASDFILFFDILRGKEHFQPHSKNENRFPNKGN